MYCSRPVNFNRLHRCNRGFCMNNIEFIRKAILFLQEIENNTEKRVWSSNYNVYENSRSDIWGLENSLYEFFRNVYDEGLVPSDYGKTYETIGDEELYRRKPTAAELVGMSREQIVSCIAKQFRNDIMVS